MKTTTTATEKNEAIESLRELCPAGTKVYCILAHVSRSGMSRAIKFVVFKDGDVRYLSPMIADALGYTRAKDLGIKVNGCGMDMGFDVVYNLGRLLHGDGYKLTREWM